MIGIYKITSPSGKAYIGQSWNILKRFIDYKYCNKAQRYIYHSLAKHGYTNHIFEIVHELPEDITQSILDSYEQLYIDTHRDCGIILMNIREAGTGGKHNVRTKELMRLASLGKPKSKQHCINNGLAKKGQYPKSAKIVVDLITKEIYPSARVAADSIGVTHSTLKSYLNGTRINKTNLQYEHSYNFGSN
jgi:group I intron endonuclease